MKNTRKKIWTVVLILAIIGAIAGVSFLCWHLYSTYVSGQEYEPIKPTQAATTSNTTPASSSSPTEATKVKGEIDFEELQKINPDLYAWIRIPNTKIDYPIAQADKNTGDAFYLDHNMYKEWASAGAIYTEKLNGKEFKDPNTLIYGHNMLNETMFRHLHNFRDEAFFNENPYIYIYLPGHKLTYEIFAAYEYDNRHILNAFDFSNKKVYQEYLDYATNPTRTMMVHTRDIPVTTDDKIITLSTCLGDIDTSRYLVQGVLIKDEPG